MRRNYEKIIIIFNSKKLIYYKYFSYIIIIIIYLYYGIFPIIIFNYLKNMHKKSKK